MLVIGGGLAGIATAVRLSRQGCQVTLVETRKRLGGRATSFADPTSGKLLDNCQHVLLRCFTQLLDLYRHLGVADNIEWHQRLYFAGPPEESPPQAGASKLAADGRPRQVYGVLDELEADDLPAPTHLTRALMGFRMLSLADKFAISRGMLAIMRMGKEGRLALGEQSFAQWLSQSQQPAQAIERFWANIIISACNELPERIAAKYALQVFQEGFLSNGTASEMGLARTPLVQLYDRAEQALTSAGGQVLLGLSADQLLFADGRVTGLIAEGKTLTADALVSTVPFDRLAKLAPAALVAADARLARLGEFAVSPILGIHLIYRRPGGGNVLDLPHLVLTCSPLHWLFNKGYDQEAQGQHLHGVISAAHDLVDQPAEQIVAVADGQVRRFLPGAADAQLVHSRVVKEKRATFSALPGVDALRPGPRGSVPNLYLAGDWCDTGWPATMEGAVRSGYQAADALLADAGLPAAPLVADLPASWLYRLISPS